MATTKINYTELTEILDLTPKDQNILLIGKHGIGKSEIISKYYANLGMKVEPLFLGQMSDPGDLLGFPKEKKVMIEDIEREIMSFLPPQWWTYDVPLCLFLDEINRARPEILQVVMDLALNKKIGGRELPKGSVVVAAANFGDEYQLTDLDPALVSRFNIYELDPTADEWISWAAKSGVHANVISFINSDNDQLDPKFDENADSMNKTPDRRAWCKVSDVMHKTNKKLGMVQIKLLSGIIGSGAVSLFKRHLDALVSIEPRDLLYAKSFKNVETELSIMTMQDIFYLNKNLFTFITINTDKIKAKAGLQDTVCKNFSRYITFLADQKLNECIADAITGIENNTEAAAMLLSDEKIMDQVAEYVDGIEL